MSAPDLTTIEGVQQYLSSQTKFATRTVSVLSGGTANFAYRLHLVDPYDGQTSLVFKHFAPFIAQHASFPFDVVRQSYEVEAMKLVRSWVPSSALINVPQIFHHDDQANVIIMEDCGPESKTLKDLVLAGEVSAELGRQLGKGIGEFLGIVHKEGASGPAAAKFASNEQARTVSIWATYGRLVSTLSGADGLPKLEDPGLDLDEELQTVGSVVARTSAVLAEANDQFVMGDFWPGNILVSLDDKKRVKRVLVVDWELAKTGICATDVGQFCAEMHLIRHFHPERKEETDQVLKAFLLAYENVVPLGPEESGGAAAHIGAHLVAWAPRVPWGDKEMTQAVVRDGVALLVEDSQDLQSFCF